MKNICTAVIAVTLIITALPLAHADYTYTTVAYPGTNITSTRAYGINNAGTIVGYYSDPTGGYGFSLSGTTFTPLNYYTSNPWKYDINDVGTIVGTYENAGKYIGFSLSGTTFTPINYPGSSHTWANSINSAGTIVGRYSDSSGIHGYTLAGTTLTPFNYPGVIYTFGYGINDFGTIVGTYADMSGYHGFSLIGTTFTPIKYPGAIETYACGINNTDTIVGYYRDASGYHGFLLSGTIYTSLDHPDTSGWTYAWDINDQGSIVGYYADNSSNRVYGFLATPTPPTTPISNISAVWKRPPLKNASGETIYNSTYQLSLINGVINVSINIKLTGAEVSPLIRQIWQDGIEVMWSNRYSVYDGAFTYPIVFHVNWITENMSIDPDYYHTVNVVLVNVLPSGASTTRWGTLSWTLSLSVEDMAVTAAHEIGHFFGLYDEYDDTYASHDPNKPITDLDAIMGTGTKTRPRYFTSILAWLNESGAGRQLLMVDAKSPPYPSKQVPKDLSIMPYAAVGDFNPVDCDVDGSDLAGLIANPSLLDITTFALNYGKNTCH